MSSSTSMYELLTGPAKHHMRHAEDEISQLSQDPGPESNARGDPDSNVKSSVEIPGWPASPQSIQKSWGEVIWAFSLDILFALLPVMFLVYAFYARYSDGVVMNAPTLVDDLQRAGKLGATAFTIVFSAIFCRSLKGLLFWRLERGEKLGILDNLAGSTSLASTLSTQVASKFFVWTAPVLAIIWALSPLGGQAVLRLVYMEEVPHSFNSTIEYLNTNSSIADLDGAVLADQVVGIMNSLTAASLAGSKDVKASSMDGWGNVKIPMLESLAASNEIESGSWFDVPKDNVSYSALIGLPTGPLPMDNSSTMMLETAYWVLDCPSLWGRTNFSSSPLSTNFTNMTRPLGLWVGGTGSGGTFFLSYAPTTSQPRSLFYTTSTGILGASNYTYAVCSIITSWVEAKIDCVRQSCSTVQMRRSQRANPPPSWTEFDNSIGSFSIEYTQRWVDGFINMITGTAGLANPVQIYLSMPDTPFTRSSVPIPPHYTLDPAVYSLRLSQLMNTYNNAHAGTTLITANLQNGFASTPARTLNTTLLATAYLPVVRCSTPWLIVLLVSSFAMLGAAILRIVLRVLATTPELDLNISSLTKDNLYLRLPSGGSTLTATERSRLQKDVIVKFGDVMPEHAEGYLAIASVDEGAVARVTKRRVYS